MKPKPISPPEFAPVRVVIVTMDSHLAGTVARTETSLRRDLPALSVSLHGADEWGSDANALEACLADIACADVVIATMLFLDEHIQAVLPALTARRPDCDAMLCALSAGEVVRLTKLGRFDMSAEATGMMAMLKRLRGGARGRGSDARGQMKMLKRLPQLLRFIPGTAQDVRAYFLSMQYWLAGSDQNFTSMIRLLVGRFAQGPSARGAPHRPHRAAGGNIPTSDYIIRARRRASWIRSPSFRAAGPPAPSVC